ncbi:MAG: gamma-glutamyltransferase [Planctomycetota bacterium]|jgi:gamma-glutamyltranspeptidase/glutathione hydrolase|nr:gamma-glutamyltransferase [Planctomycetota bacterium]
MFVAALFLSLSPLVAPAAQQALATDGYGAVCSSQVDATQVGLDILAAGGNAVDAAIAMHFALAVTYPYAGNLGGGGFFLLRDANGEAWFLDFREVAPAAATPDMYLNEGGKPVADWSRVGWKAVGVPGAVPGMWEAHQRWGKLPWKELVMPAAALARNGYVIDHLEVKRLQRAAKTFKKDALAARLFYDADGEAWPAGTRLRQPELAATLQTIAKDGIDAMRGGAIIEELVAASDAGGGILRVEDFRDYRPELRPVIRFDWQGREVLGASPPSSGGIFLQQVLTSLDGFPLRLWGFQDVRSVQLIGEASSAAFRDRNKWLGDPAGRDFDLQALVDKDYLRERRRRLSGTHYTRPNSDMPQPFAEHLQTTHFSVVDGDGAAVSCTTTLNGLFGAKVMAPGGFVMNNEMDDFAAKPGEPNQFGLVQSSYNAVIAGNRPLSSMSPAIVVVDGKVDAVVGSPGGPTILTSVLQVILNRYVFGMSPYRAVNAPRFHRQDLPPTLHFEPRRLNASMRYALSTLGQPIKSRSTLGDVNAIFRTSNGWRAIADPRWSGGAGVVATPAE